MEKRVNHREDIYRKTYRQSDKHFKNESSRVISLHCRYFWFTNVGAFIALSGVTYVQQEIGFVCGFLIPLISIILALIIFMAAHSKYVYKYTPHSGKSVYLSLSLSYTHKHTHTHLPPPTRTHYIQRRYRCKF